MKKLMLLLLFPLFLQGQTITVKDSLIVHSSTDTQGMSAPCRVYGDVFVVAHGSNSSSQWLTTFSVDNITGEVTFIDSLNYVAHSQESRRLCSVVKVDTSSYFAAMYWQGTADDIWMWTVKIEDNGSIAAAPADSYEFTQDNARFRDAINIPGSNVIVALGSTNSGTNNATLWSATVNMVNGTISYSDTENFGSISYAKGLTYCGNGYVFATMSGTKGGSGTRMAYMIVDVNESTGAMTVSETDTIGAENIDGMPRSFLNNKSKVFVQGDWGDKFQGFIVNIDTTDGTLVSNTPTVKEYGTTWATTQHVMSPNSQGWALSTSIQSTSNYQGTFRVYDAGASPLPGEAADSTFFGQLDYHPMTSYHSAESAIYIAATRNRTSNDLMIRTFSVPAPDSTTKYFVSAQAQPNAVTLTTFSVGFPSGTFSSVIARDTLATDSYNTDEQIDMVNIAGTDVYLIAWADADNTGKMQTVKIDSTDGTFTSDSLDSWQYTHYGLFPTIKQEPGTNYFVASVWDGTDTKAYTIEVSDAGAITKALVDSLDITNITYIPKIAYVDSSSYAITGWGSGTDGYISTFQVTPADGSLGSVVDAFEFSLTNFYGTAPIYDIGVNNLYFLTSRQTTNNWQTFTIHGSSADIPGDSTLFEGGVSWVYQPRCVIHSPCDTILIVGYQDGDSDAFLRTFAVDTSDGSSTYETTIDSVEYETSQGEPWSIYRSTVSPFYIVGGTGGGSDNDGYVYSFKVDESGDITNLEQSLEVETQYARGMVVLQLTYVSSTSTFDSIVKVSGVEVGSVSKVSGQEVGSIAKIMGVE